MTLLYDFISGQELLSHSVRNQANMNNIYDAIKDKENQISIFQAQISGLQAEIEALRVAARILEGGSTAGSMAEPARPVAVQSTATVAAGADKKRVWP
jgi:hypothetical protein